jgi:hypothetical protein
MNIMYANYEMRMPAEYTKLTAEETEYDGGLNPLAIVSVICTYVAPVAINLALKADLISNDTANTLSIVAFGIGLVTGVASGVAVLMKATTETSMRTVGYATFGSLIGEPAGSAGLTIKTWK